MNGQNLSKKTLVATDPYNEAWNTASAHIGYVGIINPLTGEVEKGQMILARKSNNKGNSFRARVITTDKNGTVYIGGTSSCCSVARDSAYKRRKNRENIKEVNRVYWFSVKTFKKD